MEIHTIRFYILTEGGPPQGIPFLYDTKQALEHIDALPLSFEDTRTRYHDQGNGKSLHTVVDTSSNSTDQICFRLCEVNRERLPQTEKEGVVSDLPLEDGQGLLEISHGIVFKPGLIGAISTYGPDMTNLKKYIHGKAQIRPQGLQIKPLVASDIVEKIQKLEYISLFNFKISPSQLPIIRGVWESLDDALNSQLAVWDEQRALEVIVRPRPDSQRSALRRLMQPLLALADPDIRTMLSPSTTNYKIKGQLEGYARQVILDVLSGSLTTEEEVKRINTRNQTLENDSAYHAIRKAYDALEPDIKESMEHIGR